VKKAGDDVVNHKWKTIEESPHKRVISMMGEEI